MKSIIKAFCIFTFLSTIFVSCAAWFQDKVPMDIDTNNMNLQDLFYKDEVLSKLETPKQLFASQGMYADKILLKWTDVEYASSYRIDRAIVSEDANGTYQIPDESEFDTIVPNCYSSSYTDSIPHKADNSEYRSHYFYRVTAENLLLGIESDSTFNDNYSTRGEGWLFTFPTNVEASKGKSTSDINISWNPVKGASAYKIYRTEKSNGSGIELIDTVFGNQTSYRNLMLASEQGTEFYYSIKAQNSFGESDYSSIAMGYSLKEGAPSAPGNVSIVDGFAKSLDSIKVKWDSVSASDTVSIKYSLYRTSSVDSVYTLVKNNLETTEYTDSSNLKTGIYYYYYVQTVALDTVKNETLKSSFSEKTSDSYGFLLSPPSEVAVEDSTRNGYVNLVWSPAIGSNVEEFDTTHSNINFSYNIFSSDTENGNYTELMGNQTVIADANGNLVLEVEKKNFYKISTVNASSESKLSYAAAPTPAAPKNVTASKTEQIDDPSFAPNKNNVYPVKIVWEKPSEDNPAGYIVYRSTKPDSGFRKITEFPVEALQFIDENETAKSGVFYYYKVVSVNSLGQGKKGNNPMEDLMAANGSGLQNIKSIGYGALTRDQWFREYNKTVMRSQRKLSLMHKPKDTDKLGSETIYGDLTGSLSYKAAIAGFGAEITMHYEKYADFYVNDESRFGYYFFITGNTDTSSNMSANGNMHGTVECKGMYPGNAIYNTLEIKGGGAGGGCYGVKTFDLNGNALKVKTLSDRYKNVSDAEEVHWLVGEEGR